MKEPELLKSTQVITERLLGKQPSEEAKRIEANNLNAASDERSIPIMAQTGGNSEYNFKSPFNSI